jgi:hypothetical protein
MSDARTHPASSHEFLSRLHDGELSPAEATAFRAHRDGCAQCREAVDSFERALAAYRAAPIGAPSSDLSARILRKVRAQSPSRRPFGVSFGIDIRWAGAMVAAILVALIAAPLLRKEVPKTSEPIAVSLASRVEPVLPEQSLAREKSAAPAAAPAPSAPSAMRQILAASPEEKVAAKATEDSREFAAAPSKSRPVVSQDSAAPAAKPSEAAESQDEREDQSAATSAGATLAPPRLTIRVLDERGPAPEITYAVSEYRLETLRGSEFELIVAPNGRVWKVLAPAPAPGPARKEKRVAVEPEADVLRQMRFAAGGTPRRLLVRIE